MALSKETVRELRQILLEATALVYMEGRPAGTAFFIDEELLLTCAHMVKTDTVTIRPFQRESRPAVVVSRAEPDLALLRSPPGDGEPSPCVVLGHGLDSTDCLAAGYPRPDGTDLGAEVMSVQAHLRMNLTGGDPSVIIDPGQIITWGMSGAPVASTGSGAVIAIVHTSKDPSSALGGTAIPISLAAKAFREVAAVLGHETLAMIPWRNVLGQENWRRLGRSWDIEGRIDLWVSGHRNGWEVRIVAAGWTMTHTGPDLGERVTEAIFYWARPRHIRGVDEVARFGQLLARALFPDPMPAQLQAFAQADSLTVRLHVQPGSDVADIPWELAADPFSGDRDRFLAVVRSFRFIRVADKPAAASPPEPKPSANVQVLAVFAQPADWKYADVPGPHGGKPYSWPGADTVSANLHNSIEGSGFTFKSLVPPTRGSVYGALEDGSYDVLHYMGTGKQEADGKALIAFVDEDGNEQWEEVYSILRAATRAGARLVVFELVLPPEDRDLQQLTYSSLGDVIAGSVEAAVLTNLPVHPDQCKTFNREFYKVLGRGESVETATQLARHQLKNAKPVDDTAGFGWFTVVTGRRSGIHLVIPPVRDPTLSGARQPVPGTGEPPLERPGGRALEDGSGRGYSAGEPEPKRYQTDAPAGRRVFVSYSHKDERYRQKLEISLAQLKRDNLVTVWHDRKILPGQEWDQEIDRNLESAEIVMLLVSPEFLASDYAYSREMERALERHRSRTATVIPIIVRPSDWQNSPLASLQALPSSGRPVSRWSDRDQAWLDVVRGLRRLISGQG